MLYTIQNEHLTVKINQKGAELTAVTGGDGCEYLWHGDETYWEEHSPWLFPICSHLFEDKFTYRGKTYHLPDRAFIHSSDFTVVAQSDSALTLTLCATKESRALYPFDFTFTVAYRVAENKLQIAVTVGNEGSEVMPFAFGAHPGFNVPFSDKANYDDFYLEFGEECSPDRFLFTDRVFLNGQKEHFPLKNGRRFDLSHDLFVIDGIFLSRVANEISLKSDLDPHSVTVKFPQTPYLGFWSNPDVPGPFLCIEPWHGLPSFDGIVDDLDTKNDMYRLQPGTQKTFNLEYIFN